MRASMLVIQGDPSKQRRINLDTYVSWLDVYSSQHSPEVAGAATLRSLPHQDCFGAWFIYGTIPLRAFRSEYVARSRFLA
jgi:hypothetical protein